MKPIIMLINKEIEEIKLEQKDLKGIIKMQTYGRVLQGQIDVLNKIKNKL